MPKNKTTYSFEELDQAGVWERACTMKGIDLDEAYEGDHIPYELELSDKEARKLGLRDF